MSKIGELARKAKRGFKKVFGKQTIPQSFKDEYKRRNKEENSQQIINRYLRKK